MCSEGPQKPLNELPCCQMRKWRPGVRAAPAEASLQELGTGSQQPEGPPRSVLHLAFHTSHRLWTGLDSGGGEAALLESPFRRRRRSEEGKQGRRRWGWPWTMIPRGGGQAGKLPASVPVGHQHPRAEPCHGRWDRTTGSRARTQNGSEERGRGSRAVAGGWCGRSGGKCCEVGAADAVGGAAGAELPRNESTQLQGRGQGLPLLPQTGRSGEQAWRSFWKLPGPQ